MTKSNIAVPKAVITYDPEATSFFRYICIDTECFHHHKVLRFFFLDHCGLNRPGQSGL